MKLEQIFRRRSTKLFCFSFISAARTCETECCNKFKMGVASLAGLAVGHIRAGAHRVSLRLSACVLGVGTVQG